MLDFEEQGWAAHLRSSEASLIRSCQTFKRKMASDPLDQHTLYYCEKDVERHLRAWQEAASKRCKLYLYSRRETSRNGGGERRLRGAILGEVDG